MHTSKPPSAKGCRVIVRSCSINNNNKKTDTKAIYKRYFTYSTCRDSHHSRLDSPYGRRRVNDGVDKLLSRYRDIGTSPTDTTNL